MKRSKMRKIEKSYEDLVTARPKVSEDQRKAELERFLAAGGIIYKSRRGKQKNGLTKAKISEHNQQVADSLNKRENVSEQTDKPTDENNQ